MEKISLYLEEFLWYHHLGILAAFDQGFFRQVDIEVEWFEPTHHTQGLDLVAKGKIDFALTEPIHAIPLQLQRLPIVSIGQLFELKKSSVMALASKVSSATDFLGKRLGYPTAPSRNGPTILKQVAAAHGVTLDSKSIAKVVIGSDLVGALIKDKADIVLVTAQHSVLLAQQKCLDVTLFSTEASGIPSFGHNVLVTREEVIKTKPNLVKRFVSALIQGTTFVQQDEAYARDLSQRFIQYPTDLGDAFLLQTLPVLTASLEQPIDLWERVRNWMVSAGLLADKDMGDRRFFTNEFV